MVVDFEKSSGIFTIEIDDEVKTFNINDSSSSGGHYLLNYIIENKIEENEVFYMENMPIRFKLIKKDLNIVEKTYEETYAETKKESTLSELENKVFQSNKIVENQLNYMFDYIPKYTGRQDEASKELLAFAKADYTNHPHYYKKLFDKFYCIFRKHCIYKMLDNFKETITVCCIPSSDEVGIISNTMSLVINRTVNEFPHRFINGNQVLFRKYKLEKASQNSSYRNFKVQYNSMDIRQKELIENKIVLLLDDFYSSGSTINAGSKILYEKGAKLVILFAFARTKGGY